MNVRWLLRALALVLTCVSPQVMAEAVISDQGVSMSRGELEFIVANWPTQLQQDAANDLGNRLELLNQAVASKKIAREADAMTPEQDGDTYWQKELRVRKVLRDFMVSQFIASIEVPDMSGLAKERYLTEKDKYARVPPGRLTSHILLRCGGDVECEPAAMKAHAERILAELRAGGDFEAMVLKYSEDPGSRLRKGRFDQWLEPGMKGVDRNYLEGAFAIENQGDYSEVVVSQFGYHIIRLDEVRESYYRPYDEVERDIIEALRNEYGRLQVKMFDEGYRFSDELYIDGDAMEEIFAPYKAAD